MDITLYGHDRLNAEVWNRVYSFDGLPLPSSILIGGEEILTAPAKINAFGDGGEAVWEKRHIFLQSESADEKIYAFSAQSERLIINAQVKICDDGLVWMDFMLVPQWNVAPDINELSLTIPLKRELCELLHFWQPKGQPRNSDYMPKDGVTLPFTSAVWTGNEGAGFGFYMEKAEHVYLTDESKMFELTPDGDTLSFKVTLFNHRPEEWRRSDNWGATLSPITYSFGFHCTPVKVKQSPNGFERSMHACLAQVNEEMIPEMRELGVKYLIFHEDWTMIQNYGLPEDEDGFLHFVKELHKNGIKAMAYFGYEYSTLAPGFMQNIDSWTCKTAAGTLYGGWQRLPAQRDYVCCYKGGYSEVMLERVERAMNKYSLDGIYTDGTYMPFECANEAHGCGFRDKNGTLHSGYPLLAQREHVKKLYKLVHSHGGIVDAHQSSCCIPMLLSYADSYWDGEHIQALFRADLAGFFNFGTIRSEYTGVNWGVPSQFIVYSTPEATYENICGIMLLNNVFGRPWGLNDTRAASKLWKIMDAFGAAEAKFTPCWDASCPVKTDRDGVYASCWQKDGKALVLIFSVEKENAPTNVTFNGETRMLTAEHLTPIFTLFE